MKASLICFTSKGADVCTLLHNNITNCTTTLYSVKDFNDFVKVNNLKGWTNEAFSNSDVLIFVGAVGIAVRSIAHFIKNKTTDPAVLVIDNDCRFVIPILSGHIGGANNLANIIADILGATAVITTATDTAGLFAVDSFAKSKNLYISDMTAAKHISAAILNNEAVGFKSDFKCFNIPTELTKSDIGKIGINITIYENYKPFAETLTLIPKLVYLGIGCKKNTPFEAIDLLVTEILTQMHISIKSIAAVATIDIKSNEDGLLQFCQNYNLPLVTFNAKMLQGVSGQFTASEFVKKQVGVDNVCERAAVLAAKDCKLLQRKIAKNGVTLALSLKYWSVDFE